jgi:aspartyl/glutamyl-tRNA(Asn/Gln) amidotransferase C subunit
VGFSDSANQPIQKFSANQPTSKPANQINQMEEITPEIFEKLVELAALELDPAEAEYLRRELNNQLSAIHILEGIPLPDGVEPAARGVPYPAERRPAIREDVVEDCKERDAILEQAPEMEGGYIVTPEIPHESLE